jgi:methionine-rich copper-binding protein CopC
VSQAPSELTLSFTQNLEPAFSSVDVLDEKGAKVDKGNVQVDPNDGALLRVSLNPLPPGTYKVVWHVVSVDTHPTEGDFTFQVSP